MKLHKLYQTIAWLITISLCLGCQKSPRRIVLENTSELSHKDAIIAISSEKLSLATNGSSPTAVVLAGNQELPSQMVDSDGDGQADQLLFAVDLSAAETKTVTIEPATNGRGSQFPKRTQAELSHKFGGKWQDRVYLEGSFRNVDFVRVPDEHTDHSFYFRYEGPGWESDKVGYRFYLDWRNATDIFGKRTPDMALQNVGQDGFDSYHEMADWGMDVLKVGESLGIGSVGMWHDGKVFRVSETDSITCAITANGPIFSSVQTKYFGWRVGDGLYQLESNLSIAAGSRMTRHDVRIQGGAGNLCTGLVKHEAAELLISEKDNGGWRFLANYGKQSLADDLLGMAILFRGADLIEFADDGMSHVVVLKPQDGRLSYYFLAAWEKEQEGITNKKDFVAYLEDEINKLNNPVLVNIN